MPWIFVLILMVVAGLVAAGGDRMGHRAARAKIRIGKLRPRTASTIIAVVTGVLISLVTFGVVFAVWSDFREALLRYDTVKGQLAGLKQELTTAQQQRQEAEAAQAKAKQELSQIQSQMIDVTVSLAKAQRDLQTAQAKVASSDREVKDLEAKRASLQKDIDAYKARLDDMRALMEKVRGDVTALQQGDVVMAKGTPLSYLRIGADEPGGLSNKLDVALVRLSDSLSATGLNVDKNSYKAEKDFLEQYKLAGKEAVIIISAARNVVAGENVLLSFEARELKPLVSKGDVIMEVLVGKDSARVRMTGAKEQQVAVPEKFDTNSLVDFSVSLYDSFSAGALALGFLPDLRTGEIASPLQSLTTVGSDIIGRERPFVIQFVAKSDANALDGLGAADVYISNPPASGTGGAGGQST